MNRNSSYQSAEIERYYSRHRRLWEELYPSERWMFERVGAGGVGSVLDVGCAAGGLAQALGQRFRPAAYWGVDINPEAIATARRLVPELPFPATFTCGDICACPELDARKFDWVVGLSVVDWNIEADAMLRSCWERVAEGGTLILSLRLSPEATVCDMEQSFQYIWFEAGPIPAGTERAQYTVFNITDALRRLCALGPDELLAYGYWGAPSATARTPLTRLLFTLVALHKPEAGAAAAEPRLELHWPAEALLATARAAGRPT